MENQSPSHATTPAGDRSVPSVSLTDVRVLVVEDEVPARRFLRSALEAEGASVLEAGTAEQGLLVFETGQEVAVALCDIRLPGNDGLWLAERLQIASPLTAVVVTTAVHEFDAAVTSLRVRAVDYLAKPFTRERLLEAMRRALLVYEARRAHREILKELEQRRTQHDVRTLAVVLTRLFNDVAAERNSDTGWSSYDLLVGAGAAPATRGTATERWATPVDEGSGGPLDDRLVTNAAGYRRSGPGELFGWRGAYLQEHVPADPWGNRYAVNVRAMSKAGVYTVVLSAGPNRIVESPFEAETLPTTGDDIVAIVSSTP
ncbi:MAG: response regulator [Acidobacteria bacterium]|nr:response regulator [Acidobacteriota bacterium]